MPDLPTLTVNTAQQTRILDALKWRFGTTTTAETVLEYKKWLAASVKDFVFQYESASLNEQREALRTNVETTVVDPL